MDERPTFAELLIRLRLAAGLTQEALAERTQLSVAAISTLERGARQAPRRETVRRLGDALGLGPDDRAALLAAAVRPRTIGSYAAPLAVLATASSLPASLTSFVGRDRELAAVGLLIAEGRRLLTLTGPGGVGKTRLAIEAARGVAQNFAGAVGFVDLTAANAPALVPQAVAAALGVREAPGRTLSETIAATIGERALLLVLDNCEHVLAASGELAAALLRACPSLVVLATSREPFHMRGEQRYPVAPLAVPPDAAPAGRSLKAPDAQPSAVRLFVDRARTVLPDFSLTGANAGAVYAICRQLDGLPLAIEIVAAQVQLLAPEQIAERLSSRLTAVVGSARDLGSRHRTLQAMIDWSHELLRSREQALLRRLAVFAGGWTLDAAEAVCSDELLLAEAVLDTLAALVDKSLVVADTAAQVARYRLLESIREYAREALTAATELDRFGRRHLAHYAELAEVAAPELRGPAQIAWLQRLDDEHDNLRTALRWGADRGETEFALRLACTLAPFWDARGHLSEGRRWLQTLLAMQPAASLPARLRAQALLAAGRLAQWQTQLEEAAAVLEECLAIARPLADGGLTAEALLYLGAVRRQQGDFALSVVLTEEGLALFRAAHDRTGEGLALLTLGVTVRFQGDAERSITLLEQSLARFSETGDLRWRAVASTMLGGSLLRRRDPAAAAMIREGLAGHLAVGDHAFIVFGLLGVAVVLLNEGQPRTAACMVGAVEALREVLGAPLAPANLREYEYVLRTLREQLSESELDQAWREGRELPLAEAVALALEATPRDVPEEQLS